MSTEFCVVYCTCPNKQVAEQLSEKLLSKRLVACINIIPSVSSHYIWQGAVTQDQEQLLVMKTHKSKLSNLESVVFEDHPYECPEIIAMPIMYGQKGYLAWLEDSLELESKS